MVFSSMARASFYDPGSRPRAGGRLLAEVLGARIVPLPHPHGTLLVYADDSDGTAIEIWPAAIRAGAGDSELGMGELPLPESWPHLAYITSDTCEVDGILSAFAREGWRAEAVHNGPPGRGFRLVRGWVENQTVIEIGGAAMRVQYERFFREFVARDATVQSEARAG